MITDYRSYSSRRSVQLSTVHIKCTSALKESPEPRPLPLPRPLMFSESARGFNNLIDEYLSMWSPLVPPVLKVDAHGAHVRGTKESWGDQKAG